MSRWNTGIPEVGKRVMVVTAGGLSFTASTSIFMCDDDQEKQLFFAARGDAPKCWSPYPNRIHYGVCWDKNANGKASDQVIKWRYL